MNPVTAVLVGLAVCSGLSALAGPVAAETTQITIWPPTPKLGDTLSVVVASDTPLWGGETPTVIFKGKSFALFPLNPTTAGQVPRWRALLPTSPLDQAGLQSIQVQGLGAAQLLKVNLQNRTFPIQKIQLSPSVASLEATETELTQVNQFRAQITAQKYWQGPFLAPNQGAVTTIYGVRRYYNGVFAEDYYHRGVDYGGPVGSPVVAPAAGVVRLIGLESEGFRIHGNMVGIDHGQGVTSVLLHLSRITVAEGDVVQAGQVVGAVGATGIATGPHLHWGLFVHEVSVDPVPWRTQSVE